MSFISRREQSVISQESVRAKQQVQADDYERGSSTGHKVASAMWSSFCQDILDSWPGQSKSPINLASEWQQRLDNIMNRAPDIATQILERGQTKEMAKGHKTVNIVCLDHGITTVVPAKAKGYFRDACRAMEGEAVEREETMEELVAACILLAFQSHGQGSERWRTAEDLEEMTNVLSDKIDQMVAAVRRLLGERSPELVEDLGGGWEDMADFDPRCGGLPVPGVKEKIQVQAPKMDIRKGSVEAVPEGSNMPATQANKSHRPSRVFSWNREVTGPRKQWQCSRVYSWNRPADEKRGL